MSVRKTLSQLMARRHQKMFKLLVQMVGDEISIKVALTLTESPNLKSKVFLMHTFE